MGAAQPAASLHQVAFAHFPFPVLVASLAADATASVILDCNAAAAAAAGRSRDALCGQPLAQLLRPLPDPEAWQAGIARLPDDGPVTLAALRRTATGAPEAVTICATAFPYDGQALMLLIEHPRTAPAPAPEPPEAAALRASDERLRLVLQAATMSAWEWEIATDATVWFGEPADVFQIGSAPEPGLAATIAHVVPDADRPIVANALRTAATVGELRVEHRVNRADGTTGWVESFARVGTWADGAPATLVGATRDITRRKEIEAARQASEERLRLALAAAELGTWELHVPTGQVVASAQLARLFGMQLDQFAGTPAGIARHIHPDDRVAVQQQLDAALATGVPTAARFRVIQPDGSVRWLQVHGQGVADAQGQLVRLLGVAGDITERIQLEGELQTLNADLERRVRERTLDLELANRALRNEIDDRERAEAALREQQRFLDRLLAAIPAEVYIFPLDSEGTVYHNRTFDVTLGYAPEEIAAMGDYPLAALMHPEDYARVPALRDAYRTLGDSDVVTNEFRLRHADGGWRWFASRDVLFDRDEDGQPRLILGASLDITGHKQVEESLREQERFVQRMLAAIPSQVFVFDLRGPAMVYSNRLPAELGYTAEEVQQLGPFPITALMHPADAARLPGIFAHQRTMRDDEVFANEFRVRHADGSWRWLATRDVVFLRDADGSAVQILGASIDITAVKHAQEELGAALEHIAALNSDLHQSNRLLSLIVDNVDDGLGLLDAQGTVLMANDGLARLCHRRRDELLGQPWTVLCPGTAPLVAQALRDGGTAEGRVQAQRPDGALVALDARAVAVTAAAGAVRQVVLHLTDVTERLQFEALVLQNERLAASGQVAASIAHEVNTPLQAIQNFLYLAATDDPGERTAALNLLTAEIDRLGVLMRRLLDLNRPERAEHLPLGITELIERVITLTRSTLIQRGVRVRLELADDLPRIHGRADHLTQVLFNLVLNARDAMPGGGELRVRARRRAPLPDELLEASRGAEVVVVEIEDSGEGIPAELLAQIFSPFYTTKAHGSGLGLAISSQIAEQHGGRLTARNSLGGGAVFSLVLPVPASQPGDADAA